MGVQIWIHNGPKVDTVTTMQMQSGIEAQSTIAVLEHLSGSSIGLETLLYSDMVDISLDSDRLLTVKKTSTRRNGKRSDPLIARLERAGGTYTLKALDESDIWINGRQVKSSELIDDDIIEFGEKGPLSRFRLVDGSTHQRRYFSEICDDC